MFSYSISFWNRPSIDCRLQESIFWPWRQTSFRIRKGSKHQYYFSAIYMKRFYQFIAFLLYSYTFRRPVSSMVESQIWDIALSIWHTHKYQSDEITKENGINQSQKSFKVNPVTLPHSKHVHDAQQARACFHVIFPFTTACGTLHHVIFNFAIFIGNSANVWILELELE